MCALVASIASLHSLRHFRQVGLFAIAALPWLGCAKGVEIADGEVSFFTLNPADAGGADSGADLAASASATSSGARSNDNSMPPPMTLASSAGSTQSGAPGAITPTGAARDAGTSDAGRAEDRPADAGD
jgi:hypothetical protein